CQSAQGCRGPGPERPGSPPRIVPASSLRRDFVIERLAGLLADELRDCQEIQHLKPPSSNESIQYLHYLKRFIRRRIPAHGSTQGPPRPLTRCRRARRRLPPKRAA